MIMETIQSMADSCCHLITYLKKYKDNFFRAIFFIEIVEGLLAAYASTE